MKKKILWLLMSVPVMASINVKAQTFAGELPKVVLATTFAPAISVTAAVQCLANGGRGDEGMLCSFNLITFGPISVTTAAALTIAAQREEILHVQQDAHRYLAGEAMSDALVETIQNLRNESDELNYLNDEEIVTVFLNVK